jgi:thioredoxin 1
MRLEPVVGSDWEERVLRSQVPVLVEFYRDTCLVCEAMEPTVFRLAADFENWARVFRVDVDQEEDLVWAYGVMSTPTFIIFRDGEPFHTLAGEVEYALIKGLLDDAVAGRW